MDSGTRHHTSLGGHSLAVGDNQLLQALGTGKEGRREGGREGGREGEGEREGGGERESVACYSHYMQSQRRCS